MASNAKRVGSLKSLIRTSRINIATVYEQNSVIVTHKWLSYPCKTSPSAPYHALQFTPRMS